MRHVAKFFAATLAFAAMNSPAAAQDFEQAWGFGLTHGELFRFPGQPYMPDHRDPALRNVPVAWKVLHTRVIDMGLVRPSYAARSTNRSFCDNADARLPNEAERDAFGCNGGLFFFTFPSREQAEASLARRLLELSRSGRYEILVVDVTLGSRSAPVVTLPSPTNTDDATAAAAARANAEANRADMARTAGLNREVLERDRAIAAGNADAQARYQAALVDHQRREAAHQAEVARVDAARRAYEASLADHARRRAQWQADVAACQSGDRTRCAGAAPR